MKNSLLIVFLTFLLVGCTAKDTKTLGGQMMSASGSAGVAGLITFPVGGLIYMAGSSAEEDTNKNVDVNKSSYVSSTNDDNNKTVVPYEMLKITITDVKKEDSNETTTDK